MSTQQTTIESNSHFVWPNGRTVPLSAAALWAVVAVAWSVARVLERTRAWEGSPSSAFMVGYVALIGAGILTLIHVLAATGGSTRSTKTKAGIALIGVGLAVSVAIGWALPDLGRGVWGGHAVGVGRRTTTGGRGVDGRFIPWGDCDALCAHRTEGRNAGQLRRLSGRLDDRHSGCDPWSVPRDAYRVTN